MKSRKSQATERNHWIWGYNIYVYICTVYACVNI